MEPNEEQPAAEEQPVADAKVQIEEELLGSVTTYSQTSWPCSKNSQVRTSARVIKKLKDSNTASFEKPQAIVSEKKGKWVYVDTFCVFETINVTLNIIKDRFLY